MAFLKKFSEAAPELRSVPPPTLCPNCRQMRRLARRNERSYHKHTCDFCKQEIVTMYGPDVKFPVYCYSCWWSDAWDPLSFGKELDLQRSFIQQFAELQNVVPRIALYGKNNENCDYINHSVNAKNCYLCVDVASRDVYYSKWMIQCADCCDSYQLEKSELCYESQYSVGLYSSKYAFLCDRASNLAFCYDCEDCHDCFLCTHLRHKRFCIQNEQCTEEEYREKMAEWNLGSYSHFQEALRQYQNLWKTTFHRAQQIIFSEDCSGDFVYRCKNVRDSYGVIESQDCRYCYDAGFMRDCYDAYEPAFDCELQYDSHGCNGGKRLIGCHICYDNDALAYCDSCHNAQNLFGCIGLRRKKHCILNKQYTKEEYQQLLPKVIERMGKDGEWGEFFPVKLSPFSYNETTANEYEPLTKDEAIRRGFRWKDVSDDLPNVTRMIPAERLPDNLHDIPDDIVHWAIRCEVTERPFRIIKQELDFYRKLNIPISHLHPDERHRRRMGYTNPRKLWKRACASCGKEIQTTYASDRPEKIYCEDCYLKAVYR